MTIDNAAFVKARCIEILGDALDGVGYYGVGDVENIGGGAIVTVQNDVGGSVKIHEYLRVGTAPFVDRLVRVSDNE